MACSLNRWNIKEGRISLAWLAMDIPTLCCVWKTAISSNNWYPQECIPVGCVPSAAVAVCEGGDVWPGGCLLAGICPGGCLPGMSAHGVSTQGVYPSMHLGRHPPPVDRILDTCLWKHYLSATSFADGKDGWHTKVKYDSKFFVASFYL